MIDSRRMRLWPKVTLFLLGIVFWMLLASDVSAQGIHQWAPVTAVQPDEQILTGDLDVGSGEVIDGNVVVYNGDVNIAEEGAIRGSLVVYSGHVEVEESAAIDGDVSAFSGNMDIAGNIGGNVAAWSGDVTLRSSANVAGDVSVLSGEVEREAGAQVAGNVLRGPNFRFTMPPTTPFGFRFAPNNLVRPVEEFQPPTLTSRLLGFFARLFAAFAGSLLLTLLVGVVMLVKPEIVQDAGKVALGQTALSFVAGLFSNLVLAFTATFLAITVCLAPLALLPLFLLVAVNIVGWAAVSLIAGRRLADWANLDLQPLAQALLGAFVLLILTAPLWALGGCFRVVAFVALLLISSIGVGAVIVPWLERGRGSSTSESPAALLPDTDEQDAQDEQEAPLAEMDPSSAEAAPVVVPDPSAMPQSTDDFTRIKGIGAVFAGRLTDAGILSFSQLASMSAEEIGEIIGWPAERVVRSELIEQAATLADRT